MPTKIVVLVLCGAIALAVSGRAAPDPVAAPPASSAQLGPADRFDDLVRDDFFAGMQGDRLAFDRAMKFCAEILAKQPHYPPAMAWQGNGLLFLSGQAFRAGDAARGLDLWQRGLKEMNDAVALAPDSLQTLIPRGATFLGVSKYLRDEARSRALVRTGVADYEKVLEIQKPHFAALPTHARGELLFGLADGWLRLGNREKSRQYLRMITQDLAGTGYAVRAADWLKTTDLAALRRKSRTLSCSGCHDE